MSTPFHTKLMKAQSTCLEYGTIFSEPLVGMCVALSDAIGCPLEFIIFPLLTIIAGCMGINAHTAINQMWTEPAIIWFIVAANKGQKKTAALRLLKKPLEEIEEREERAWQQTQTQRSTSNTTPPQLCIDNFSFEELHSVMKRNGSQILGLFDEMSTMYSQLDLYKQSGSVMDRKTLITLNGGSSWSRNYKTYTASMKQTAFNMSGFIQPSFVEKMLLSEDADGFNDRQFFVFQPQRDVFLNDLKQPVPPNIPPLKSMYTLLRTIHSIARTYTITGEAIEAFREYHDSLVIRQSRQVDGNIQSILSKARGYTARLAMIIHALEQALAKIIDGECDECPSTLWSVDIPTDCIRASVTIMDYLIEQKLIMMDLIEQTSIHTETDNGTIHDAHRIRKLLVLPVEEDGHISPSKVAQKHICAPVDGKYTVHKAIELFQSASSLGFGASVEHIVPGSNRKVTKFRKIPYIRLSADARKALRQIRITEDEYRRSFPNEESSSDSSLPGDRNESSDESTA